VIGVLGLSTCLILLAALPPWLAGSRAGLLAARRVQIAAIGLSALLATGIVFLVEHSSL
jgi:hypothetical protein